MRQKVKQRHKTLIDKNGGGGMNAEKKIGRKKTVMEGKRKGEEREVLLRRYAGIFTYQSPETIQGVFDLLFADGVVTTGVVVGGILLSRNHLFRVEELAIWTRTDFI